MVRTRLAALVVASGILGSSGCAMFSEGPLFWRWRGNCCPPADCCSYDVGALAPGCCEGPLAAAPPGPLFPAGPTVPGLPALPAVPPDGTAVPAPPPPLAPAPRVVPVPQAAPSAYVPSSLLKFRR